MLSRVFIVGTALLLLLLPVNSLPAPGSAAQELERLLQKNLQKAEAEAALSATPVNPTGGTTEDPSIILSNLVKTINAGSDDKGFPTAAELQFRDTFSFLNKPPPGAPILSSTPLPARVPPPPPPPSSRQQTNFRVLSVRLQDGNYTGELDGRRMRHGWGEMYFRNGSLYGPGGIFIYGEGDRYVGQWQNNSQHGIGTFFSQTGTYVGDWMYGVQTGNGTALYNNGNQYAGQFSNGLKHGYGVFTVVNGDRYSGYFVNGMRHGQGIEMFHNGERYIGEYQRDLQNGRGTSYYANGSLKYAGQWLNGQPHGNGTFYMPNRMRFEGEFQFGQMRGRGTVFNPDGSMASSGVWSNYGFISNSNPVVADPVSSPSSSGYSYLLPSAFAPQQPQNPYAGQATYSEPSSASASSSSSSASSSSSLSSPTSSGKPRSVVESFKAMGQTLLGVFGFGS